MLRLTPGELTAAVPFFTADCLAAAPLAATRAAPPTGAAPRDLLLLRPSGQLHLLVGRTLMCSCTLPPRAAAPADAVMVMATPPPLVKRLPTPAGSPGNEFDCDMDTELTPVAAATPRTATPAPAPTPAPAASALHAGSDEVVDLRDACGSRATLVMADGTLLRVCLPLAPLAPLVASLLAMLHCTLSAEACACVVGEYSSCEAACGDSADNAFAALSAAILRWAGVGGAEPARGEGHAPGWEALLGSELHARCFPTSRYPALLCTPAPPPPPSLGAPPGAPLGDAARVLGGVHALYEDHKLDLLRWPLLRPLAALATRLAQWVHAPAYVEHYQRDWGGSLGAAGAAAEVAPAQPPPPALPPTPPDALRALAQLLHSGECAGLDAALPPLLVSGAACCAWGAAVCALFRTLAREGAAALPPACAAAGFDAAALARLPPGVALPLLEAFAALRAAPPDGWHPAAYALLDRPDLAAQCSPAPPPPPPQQQQQHRHRAALSHVLPSPEEEVPGAGTPPPAGEEPAAGEAEADGMEELAAAVGPLRFGRDERLAEVRRLLRSSAPVPLRLHGDGADGEQGGGGAQPRLWALAARTCALALGRGALTLATWRPLPTQPLPLPQLCLSGALPAAHNAVVALSLSAAGAAASWTVWPEFHNGVAAGLRLAPLGQAQLTRTWVLYARPGEASAAHAGMLLALGLCGQLGALASPDQFRLLEGEHPPTTIALLLGMGASRLGSAHAGTSRTLHLHLPSRHPASFPELEMPPGVQAAALVGLGLLYQQSGQRGVAETLLSELERAQGGAEERVEGREGHALAAGLALGMVLLQHGRRAPQLAELGLEGRLAALMRGGGAPPEPPSDSAPLRPADAGVAGGGGGGGLMVEGRGVNLGVTSSGATLALALLFLRTNDAAAAAHFSVPETHFELDYVRPDQLLLRVLGRALVLWDGVAGSEEWVDSQLPPLLRGALQARGGGGDGGASGRDPPGGVDREALCACEAYVRAGACLALGLRYAGTCHAGAAAVLHRHARLFLELKRRHGGGAGSVERHTLETAACCCALALGCLMAGSGDLQALRLLRRMRRRVEPIGGAACVAYGSHLAVSLALGWLFLGGGARTFSTEPGCTAALLCAVVPPYPGSPVCQRGHLQALRHLYVLAAVPRLVRARDADTGLPCYAPLEVQYGDGEVRAACAPCLAPRAQDATALRVLGPRHWPHTLRGERLRAVLCGTAALTVKRRSGCLPYAADPAGTRSLHSQATALAAAAAAAAAQPPPGEQEACPPGGEAELRAFWERAAAPSGTAGCGSPFYTQAMTACVGAAPAEAAPVYLALHAAVGAAQGAGGWGELPLPLALHSTTLCAAFYAGRLRQTALPPAAPPLLQRALVDACHQMVACALREAAQPNLPAFLASHQAPTRQLGAYLAFYGVPPRHVLQRGLASALEAAAAPDGGVHATPLPAELLRLLVTRR